MRNSAGISVLVHALTRFFVIIYFLAILEFHAWNVCHKGSLKNEEYSWYTHSCSHANSLVARLLPLKRPLFDSSALNFQVSLIRCYFTS